MSENPGNTILDLCLNTQHFVLAAPYIKTGALGRILTGAKSTASLVCITRWQPDDIIVGASDIGCRALVVDRGGSFRLHPFLHAKYYRMDDVVLVGSANLTSSAMGWASQPNLEILCRAGDDFDAQGFERELLRNSREISDIEFARWETLVEIDARSSSAISGVQPLLDAWRPTTRDPRNLELAYFGREDEIASFDEQRAASRDIQAISIPPGLTDNAVRAWISTCLLAAPFTNSVMRLSDLDTQNAAGTLAEIYRISATDARRDMETVQNWLSFLALEDPIGST